MDTAAAASSGVPAYQHGAGRLLSADTDAFEHLSYPSDDEPTTVCLDSDEIDSTHESSSDCGSSSSSGGTHSSSGDSSSDSSCSSDDSDYSDESLLDNVRLPTPPHDNLKASERDTAETLRRVQRENLALRAQLEEASQSHAIGVTPSTQLYACRECHATLTVEADIVSKDFAGMKGRGYFVDQVRLPCIAFLSMRCLTDRKNQVYNVKLGRVHNCTFKTGKHLVADLICQTCADTTGEAVVVGWKYLKASARSQKYKEGKFVVEEYELTKTGTWGWGS